MSKWRKRMSAAYGVVAALTFSGVGMTAAQAAVVDDATARSEGEIAVVGDSLTAGLLTDLSGRFAAVGFGPIRIDAAVSRRMTRQAGSVSSGATVVRALRSSGIDPQNWVIALGTNDYYESASSMESMIEQVVDEAGADQRVMWMNVWMTSSPDASLRFNSALARVAARRSNLVVLDWAAVARQQPSWFAADGVHHTGEGLRQRNSFMVARAIESKLAVAPPIAPVVLQTVGPLLAYSPVSPSRQLDTRQPGSTSLSANETRRVDLSAVLPADARAAILNLTAIGDGSSGFVTAWDCGATVPPTSSVNYPKHAARAASAVVTLDVNRGFCLKAETASDVIVDVVGAWTESGDASLFKVPSQRLFDTRQGATAMPLQPNTVVRIAIPRAHDEMAPTAAFVNVTASNASAAGFVTMWPCGGTVPTVSTLNFAVREDIANAAWVPTDGSGTVCASVSAPADLIVDLSAVIDEELAGARYQAVVPTRVIDTRSGLGSHSGAWAAARVGREYGMMPLTIGLLETVTVTEAHSSGYVTIGRCAGDLPPVSTLNFGSADVANTAFVSFASDVTDCHVRSADSHLVVDVVGHFQAYLVGPAAELDSGQAPSS
jgi:hypothetical protein